MRTLYFLFTVFQLINLVFGQCGPAQCYNGCTDARVPLDLVFIIDVSGSMGEEINGIVSGLTQFATDLESESVIPWYTLIIYGNGNNEARILLNGESNSAVFKNTMAQISVGGGWEPAFETMRRAMNTANSGNFNVRYRYPSKKAIILATDEDSDPAYFSANRFQSAGNDGTATCSPSNYQQWQNEIDHVSNALIGLDASSYLLVKTGTGSSVCLTRSQLGDYDLQTQNSDFKNFNPTDTLNRLRNAGYGNCLQAKQLENGKLSRTFRVESLSNSVFVKNFFESITADVSACDAKCLVYNCSPQNTCLPPVNICGCDGVPNSGKTLDSFGTCCSLSERDCTGRCFGKSVYDECGVCGASRSNLCQQDCQGKWYLTSKPSSLYISDSFQPDPAGYLLMNSDLYTQFASPSGSLRSTDALRNHFHSFGRFEGRFVCTFDSNRYSTQYGVSVDTAKDHWINNLLANTALNSKNQAFCVTNSRVKLPPTSQDSCAQCIISPDTPPYCVLDCTNQYRTTLQTTHFIDNCGKCVAPGTNPDVNKDDCGVCFGKNVNKNQCNQCFGSTALDGCSNPVCEGKNCNVNCDGESEVTLTKQLDECGKCVLITSVRHPDCVQDCANNYYLQTSNPPFIVDECNNCVPFSQVRHPECKQDCSGVWNGTAYYDDCDQCIDGVDDFRCVQDCNGLYYRLGKDTPVYTVDSCNECNNLENQNNLVDNCGVCTNKNGYNSTAECTPDCKGIYTLPTEPRSFIDFCGDCWFANQTQFNNYRMDDCGVCLPTRDHPDWNKNREKDDNGVFCLCFQSPNICLDLQGKEFSSCLDCPSTNPCLEGIPDSCGLCPDKSMYNQRDKCGLCCSPEDGIPCDVDIDDCGKCFGNNKDKELNPCRVCDSSKCVVDCLGAPNGTAVIGCDGVCNSNAVCFFCGNGIVDEGETCDLGNGKNTRGSGCFNCQAEQGEVGRGSLIGGIIGGVAAVAFLALSGFLAFQYAKKNGLIGKVGKNVDFTGSNNNPLYTSDTRVQANPLYAN